jgi:hypothetical protein
VGAVIAVVAPEAGKGVAAEEVAGGSTVLFHGTDAASASDILTNGVNLGNATALGG